jgi:hypothetical protein
MKLNRIILLFQKSKQEQNQEGLRFKCSYCDQVCLSNNDRVQHIENEHQGKLLYPTPEDFQDRLNRILDRDHSAK